MEERSPTFLAFPPYFPIIAQSSKTTDPNAVAQRRPGSLLRTHSWLLAEPGPPAGPEFLH